MSDSTYSIKPFPAFRQNESFFATLECELLDRVLFRTIPEGCQAVFVFLED